jgi:hypothetical protein
MTWQVLRQGSFVKKLHALRWTEPDFFETSEDEIALQHAIARYHAFVLESFCFPIGLDEITSFLDLMATSAGSFLVPTLDIDLAWHTHQLMAHKYDADCKTFVERYVDQ